MEAKKLEFELVLVDWNPPDDKPPLRIAIEWPKNLYYSTIKVVEVTSEIHRRYKYWQKRMIHGSVAVNTGFRRSRGQFIVNLVSDAFWSEKLISLIAERKLEKGYLYRCDRIDSKDDFALEKYVTYEALLSDLKKHEIIRNKRIPFPDEFKGVVFPQLHTNACGDFQLMHRDHFYSLRGYYETEDVGCAHVDGILSFAAYAAGIKEFVLPDEMCVYKIAHHQMHHKRLTEDPSIWEKMLTPSILPEQIRGIIKNYYGEIFGYPMIHYEGIPIPHYYDFLLLIREILSGEKSYILNPENWGLINDKLKQYIVNKAYWDKHRIEISGEK